MKYIFSLVLISMFQISIAQDWVITTKIDTIIGKIDIELPDETFEEIIIKNSVNKQHLKAYQFLEFSKDSIRYKTIKLHDVYRIMKVEKEGYLSLYYYRENGSYDFSSEYLLKVDGSGSHIPSLSFRKTMSNFLADCDEVNVGLENNQYNRSDLFLLMDNYNYCIEKKTQEKTQHTLIKQNWNNPIIVIINSIKNKVNDSNQELVTLLEDIKNKIAQEKSVPEYLKSALKDLTEGDLQIRDEVIELLKSIEN